MSRLYEWEVHLTDDERKRLMLLEEDIETQGADLAKAYKEKDAMRRKAIQRARHALHKQLRADAKERAGV